MTLHDPDVSDSARRRDIRRIKARRLIALVRGCEIDRVHAWLDSLPPRMRRRPVPLTSPIGASIGLRKVRTRRGSLPFVSIQHGGDVE